MCIVCVCQLPPHLAFSVGSEEPNSNPQTCKPLLQPSYPCHSHFLTNDLSPHKPLWKADALYPGTFPPISPVPKVSHYIVMTKIFCLMLSYYLMLFILKHDIVFTHLTIDYPDSRISAGTIKKTEISNKLMREYIRLFFPFFCGGGGGVWGIFSLWEGGRWAIEYLCCKGL